MLHVSHTPPIFTALYGRTNLIRDIRVTFVVMCECGLFNPCETFVFERAQTLDGLSRRERLIVVHHDGGLGAGGAADGTDHGEIFRNRRITDLRLTALKSRRVKPS